MKKLIVPAFLITFPLASIFATYLPYRMFLKDEGNNYYIKEKVSLTGDEAIAFNEKTKNFKSKSNLDPTESNEVAFKKKVTVIPDGIFHKVVSVDTVSYSW